MVRVPGGRFRMGATGFYPEEAPVREVVVDAFLVDRHPVTVAQFRRFVEETGYVTLAERPLDPRDYPHADPALVNRDQWSSSLPRAGAAQRQSRLVGIRAGSELAQPSGSWR
jgi:formylglycine-generating enzyme required for sulfatase activity